LELPPQIVDENQEPEGRVRRFFTLVWKKLKSWTLTPAYKSNVHPVWDISAAKAFFMRRMADFELEPVETAEGHEQLAHERNVLSRYVRSTMCGPYRLDAPHVARVAEYHGSVVRNRNAGPNWHICLPVGDKKSVDLLVSSPGAHLGLEASVRDHPNDVAFHSLVDCRFDANLRIFHHSDYNVPTWQIADSVIKAGLGIVMTHRFVRAGDQPAYGEYYDGEATWFLIDGRVCMTTRKGSVHHHTYHNWLDEGYIIGSLGIVTYRLVKTVGHTSVYLLWPVPVELNGDDPMVLKTSNPSSADPYFRLSSAYGTG